VGMESDTPSFRLPDWYREAEAESPDALKEAIRNYVRQALVGLVKHAAENSERDPRYGQVLEDSLGSLARMHGIVIDDSAKAMDGVKS